jgi:hypothetical protein
MSCYVLAGRPIFIFCVNESALDLVGFEMVTHFTITQVSIFCNIETASINSPKSLQSKAQVLSKKLSI